MKGFYTIIAAAALAYCVAGCSDTYELPKAPLSPPAKEKPKADEARKFGTTLTDEQLAKQKIENFPDVDITSYGLTMYPGSTFDEVSKPLKSRGPAGNFVIVTLATTATPKEVVKYYRDLLKETTDALASVDFGGVEGTTSTGNHVTIVTAPFEGKNQVILTVTTK